MSTSSSSCYTPPSNTESSGFGSDYDVEEETSPTVVPARHINIVQNLDPHPVFYDRVYNFILIEELLRHGIVHSGATASTQSLRDCVIIEKVVMHPLFTASQVVNRPRLAWNPSAISLNVRSLADVELLLEKTPHLLYFGRGGLSGCPYLDMSWVERFPDQNWCFHAVDGVSSAPRFEIGWVDRLQTLQRAGYLQDKAIVFGNFGVSRYATNLTLDDVRALADVLVWGGFGLSSNPSLSESWLQEFTDMPWDWFVVQTHARFKLAWLRFVPEDQRLPRLQNLPVDTPATAALLTQVAETIMDTGLRSKRQCPPCVLDMLADWDPTTGGSDSKRLPGGNALLFRRFNIGWLDVFTDEGWDFGSGPAGLSRHRNFDITWVAIHPQAGWDFGYAGISSSRNLDLTWMERYPDQAWSTSAICANTNFSFAWVPRLLELNVLAADWVNRFRLSCRMLFRSDVEARSRALRRDLKWVCVVAGRFNAVSVAREIVGFLCGGVHSRKTSSISSADTSSVMSAT